MAGASLHTGGSIPHRMHWKRMDKFEQRKIELSSHSSTFVSEENGSYSNPSTQMPSDLDIWVDSVGKKNGRVFGLGSVNKTLITSSMKSSRLPANLEDVDALRSQIHALNASLQRQEEEKSHMKKQLDAIMQHLGFVASSSGTSTSAQQRHESDDDDDYETDSDNVEQERDTT